MLTNAVRLSSSKVCVLLLYFWTLTRRLQAGFRNYYYSTNKVTWETHRSFFWSGSYKPYIDFNYLTCDVNAICSNGNCVCSQYYSGTGVACTCAYFGGRTWLLTIYSFRFCLRDCLHGQRKLPQVGHRHHRCGHLLASVRRKSDGCLQQQGLGFRSKPLRVCVLNRSLFVTCSFCSFVTVLTCPVVANGPGNANYPLANAGTTATGTCVSGYSGSASLACSDTGVWSTTAITSCTRTMPP